MKARELALACAVVALTIGSPDRVGAQRGNAATGSATLTVVVSTEEPNSQPLRHASVSLQASELGVPRTLMTGDDGRVVFDALPPGNYLVSAAKPSYVRTFYGSRLPGTGPGVAVALVDGQRLELRVSVLRGAVISGVVRTPSGRPAANVTVQVADRKRSRAGQASMFGEAGQSAAQTDDRGLYRIFGLSPGDYVVSARSPTRDEVRVITAAELQWADKRVSGASASAGGSTPVVSGSTAAGPPSAFAPVYYPGTTVAADAGTITLGPGQERLGVDFGLHLVPTAQIRGRLVDGEGRPQPNQSISARLAQPAGSDVLQIFEAALGSSARTGGDGSFTMNALRPGRYSLDVRATPRTGNEPPAAAGRAGGPGAGTHWVREELTVAGVDITDLTLVLKPGMTVSGRVVYEGTTLSPPKDAGPPLFSLMPAGADMPTAILAMSPANVARITVAADGTFSTAALPPGRYRLVTQEFLMGALAPNAVARAGGWVLKTAIVGGRDVADAALEVRAGEDVPGIVVTFTDRPTSLTGQVFDQAGRVTANFPIVIVSTDRATWVPASRRLRIVQPATDGRFAAVGLPAGEYFVAAVTAIEPDQLADPAFLEQLAAMSIRVSIADGEKKSQDLKLGGQ